MKRISVAFKGIILGSALALALAAPAQAGETHTVEMKNHKFIPQEITINPGDTVRWVNKESRQYHSVWFKQEDPDRENPKLFSKTFWPGDDPYTRTFKEPGDYPYICKEHIDDYDMEGVVHVVEE